MSKYQTIPLKRGIFEINSLLDILDKTGGVIAGGYARYCASSQYDPVKPEDIDVFCKDNEEFVKISTALQEAGFDLLDLSSIAHSFYPPYNNSDFSELTKVQLIVPVTTGEPRSGGTVEEILDSFDFTVSKAAINTDRKTATVHPSFKRDEESRNLVIEKAGGFGDSLYCFKRLLKYIAKGYKISDKELMSVLNDYASKSDEYRKNLTTLVQNGSAPTVKSYTN